VGQNVFLTSAKGEYVFRGRPFYDEQLDVEKFIVESLHEHTNVNVAYPYLVDDSTDIFGFKYAIMPRLPGIQIASGGTVIAGLSKEDRFKIAQAMAAALAEMHKLTFELVKHNDGAAVFTPPNMVQEHSDHAELTIRRLKETIAGLPEISTVTNEDTVYMDDIIEKNIDALSFLYEPGFIMGDFKEDNVVFSNENGDWKVCGAFDFAMSHFGNSECDIPRAYAMYIDAGTELAKEFIREYTRLNPPKEGFYRRLKIYSLSERLGIWWWAKSQKRALWDENMPLREWLSPYFSVEY
jgi:aminoglycoside phosphotransferase (APT) family kinase protein